MTLEELEVRVIGIECALQEFGPLLKNLVNRSEQAAKDTIHMADQLDHVIVEMRDYLQKYGDK